MKSSPRIKTHAAQELLELIHMILYHGTTAQNALLKEHE
jgi:hypothetical protein